jgi:hypothetical protein
VDLGEAAVEEGYREVVAEQMDFYACLIRRKYEENKAFKIQRMERE